MPRNYSRLKKEPATLTPARVTDIVLNTDSILAIKLGGERGHTAIGTIECEIVGESSEQDNAPIYARPLNDHIKYYPLKNEVVLLIKTISKNAYKDRRNTEWYYMQTVNLWGNQNHNSMPKGAKYGRIFESAPKGFLHHLTEDPDSIFEAEGEEDMVIDHGYHFKERNTIKPLLPYEGDYIVEGRFGQSIRFGSTVNNTYLRNKEKNQWSYNITGSDIGDPITIISNGLPQDPKIYETNNNAPESEQDSIDRSWIHTTENINHDPSSIYLTSNQAINNFKPAGAGNKSMLAEF